MNEAWVRSLQLHHRKAYSGQPRIDVTELVSALKLLPSSLQASQLVAQAIRSKIEKSSDEEEDLVTFNELVQRIYQSQRDREDLIFLQDYFKLIDLDRDGFINYADIEAMKGQLGGFSIGAEAFHLLLDRITHEGSKISKAEFIQIVRAYI